MELNEYIRDVPDFPKPGIVFKDITPLLENAVALDETVDRLCQTADGLGITRVVGIESRGFIFGTAVAVKLGVGFIPVRKPGKLPCEILSETYSLEYGTDTIEMHKDALEKSDRVLLVDDLLVQYPNLKLQHLLRPARQIYTLESLQLQQDSSNKSSMPMPQY